MWKNIAVTKFQFCRLFAGCAGKDRGAIVMKHLFSGQKVAASNVSFLLSQHSNPFEASSGQLENHPADSFPETSTNCQVE
jgi:hypothetical protein